MYLTFRRLLGAIILIATIGGASVLALKAQAGVMSQDSVLIEGTECVYHG